jgi:hypothetical protein
MQRYAATSAARGPLLNGGPSAVDLGAPSTGWSTCMHACVRLVCAPPTNAGEGGGELYNRSASVIWGKDQDDGPLAKADMWKQPSKASGSVCEPLSSSSKFSVVVCVALCCALLCGGVMAVAVLCRVVSCCGVL